MAKCVLCNKDTAVSLYIRAKPLISLDTAARKYQAAKSEHHKFFGYWPPESHLANYFRHGSAYLQSIFDNNCRGHTVDEIAESLEQIMPPLSGVPIQLLWNPSPKVREFLRAEIWREREQARLDIVNDLRKIICFSIEEIKPKLRILLNSAEEPDTAKVFYPGKVDGRFSH